MPTVGELVRCTNGAWMVALNEHLTAAVDSSITIQCLPVLGAAPGNTVRLGFDDAADGVSVKTAWRADPSRLRVLT